jgi:hypothetical protein
MEESIPPAGRGFSGRNQEGCISGGPSQIPKAEPFDFAQGRLWGTRPLAGSIVFEEFFMGTSPLQVNIFIGNGVNKHPIRFNVCIPVSGPIEFERMIFVSRRQGLLSEQKFDQHFQFIEVFASLLKPLHVAVKLS